MVVVIDVWFLFFVFFIVSCGWVGVKRFVEKFVDLVLEVVGLGVL